MRRVAKVPSGSLLPETAGWYPGGWGQEDCRSAAESKLHASNQDLAAFIPWAQPATCTKVEAVQRTQDVIAEEAQVKLEVGFSKMMRPPREATSCKSTRVRS